MCPVVLYALRTKNHRAAGVGAAGHVGDMAGGRAGKRPGATAPARRTGPLLSFLFDTSFLLYALDPFLFRVILGCLIRVVYAFVGEGTLVLNFVIFSLTPSKLSFFPPSKFILSSGVFRAATAALRIDSSFHSNAVAAQSRLQASSACRAIGFAVPRLKLGKSSRGLVVPCKVDCEAKAPFTHRKFHHFIPVSYSFNILVT